MSVELILVAGASFVVAVVATPALATVGARALFVDRPSRFKAHRRATPCLGGVAVMLAVASSAGLSGHLSMHSAVAILLGALMGVVGLIDDARPLNVKLKLGPQVLLAGIAVAFGIGQSAPDAGLVEAVVGVLWIVAITNAVNLMDNMDGLAALVSAGSATGVMLLASASGQLGLAMVAMALAAGTAGFLVHNLPPARVFMGDAGSMFIGSLLAVLSIEVVVWRPESAMVSWSIPLLLLLVPLADTATVVVCRSRSGRKVTAGGQDHLSHRLAQRCGSKVVAVSVLALNAFVSAIVAAAVGNAAIGLVVGLAIVAIPLVPTLVIAWSVDIYGHEDHPDTSSVEADGPGPVAGLVGR